MDGAILDRWSHDVRAPRRTRIVPDGCRDLIVEMAPGEAPRWFVSPLDATVREVRLRGGVAMRGYRLRAGAQLDEASLLASVQGRLLPHEAVVERIHACGRICPSVAEALGSLAAAPSVGDAARRLGVGRRTLERLLARSTGRPPVFWVQLGRVRRAARAIGEGHALAEVAHRHGFADQAHMTRQFRRWLGVTPAAARRAPNLQVALARSGFG